MLGIGLVVAFDCEFMTIDAYAAGITQ